MDMKVKMIGINSNSIFSNENLVGVSALEKFDCKTQIGQSL